MYCKLKYNRDVIRDHLMNCEEAELTCPHCKGQFQKKSIQIHITAQCEENFIQCGRCHANFKRKYKEYHDCVRHLQNQQKTMQEQMKQMRAELEIKESKIDVIEQTYKKEIFELNRKLNEFMMREDRNKSSNRASRRSKSRS